MHEVDNVGVRDHQLPVAVVRRRQRDERFEFLAQVIADLLAQLARRVVRAIGRRGPPHAVGGASGSRSSAKDLSEAA